MGEAECTRLECTMESVLESLQRHVLECVGTIPKSKSDTANVP